MKYLPYAIAATIACCLLTPSLGFSQPETTNNVGLYLTSDGYGGNVAGDVGVPISVFLVLWNIKDSEGSPYSGVSAFECRMEFNPTGGIFKLAEAFPANGMNSGDADHLGNGYLEYVVEFAEEVPVIEGAVMLAEFLFMNLNPESVLVTLGPTSSPSIPDEMSFLPAGSPLEIMVPSSGHPDWPVFIFGYVSPAENVNSFGSVKALFR